MPYRVQKGHRRWLRILPVIVLVMFALTGCQGLPSHPLMPTVTPAAKATISAEQRQLEETVWVLQSINEEPALPDVEVTLNFILELDGGRVLGGDTGCNRYGMPYKITSNGLEIPSQPIATAKGCSPENIMEQEEQYYEILSRVSHYNIESNMLTLLTETGEMLVFLSQK